MMFETSDKNHVMARGAGQVNSQLGTNSAAASNGGIAKEQVVSIDARLRQIEEKEADLKKQELEITASKDKVFAKWQDYLERSEKVESRD